MAVKTCQACGKVFEVDTAKATCSEACSKAYKKYVLKMARKRREANLTPAEKAAKRARLDAWLATRKAAVTA